MSDQSPGKTLTLSSVMCENQIPSRSQQTNKIDRRTLSGEGGSRQRERENPDTDDIDQTSHENTTNIVYFK